MTTKLIQPGILVGLRTTVNGGVRYNRVDLDNSAEATLSPSTEVARIAVWKTTKEVTDPAEHEAAEKARNKARKLVRSVCIETAFGLLCPESREEELSRAIDAAMAVADEHNASAKWSHVGVYAIRGRVAANDEQAARAISSEVRDMLSRMDDAVARLDVKAIREAADKAKKMEALLSPDLAVKASEAVAAARKVARDVARVLSVGGDAATVVVAQVQRAAIESARFAFAELDSAPVADVADALPPVDLGRVAAVEMDAAVAAPDADASNDVEPAPISHLDLALLDVSFEPFADLSFGLDLESAVS
jgi:hypothetical protein